MLSGVDVTTPHNQSLVAPLWMAHFPWDSSGEMDFEYFTNWDGTSIGRYAGFTSNSTLTYLSYFYPPQSIDGSNPFSFPQRNTWQWFGGGRPQGDVTNRVRFTSDIISATSGRYRVGEVERMGSEIPGVQADGFHIWIELNGIKNGTASNELIVESAGADPLVRNAAIAVWRPSTGNWYVTPSEGTGSYS